ncbi:MAG: CarD family transcriptional regulator [Alphaproteobacteria bacterium]|nr:CarD family transcriptional regulator [Alphaproteobacteria bacterium]
MMNAFSLNDHVVYPTHGVGVVTSKIAQVVGGISVDVLVISFPQDKMTVHVPVKNIIAAGLRKLSTKKELQEALAVLKTRPTNHRGMWSRRAQLFESLINSGNLSSLATVVRDLHRNIENPDCSYSERQIYDSAFKRFIDELSAIESLNRDQAKLLVFDILKIKQAA